MRHENRLAPVVPHPRNHEAADPTAPIGGEGKTLEADWSYVGRKPGAKVKHGSASHMIPVLSLVERDGTARSFHMPNIRAENLRDVIGEHASRKSDFMTDEARAFTEIGWNFASHGTVTHSENEYVRGDVHTNTRGLLFDPKTRH
jgi:ISXO2-like transposase domain